MFTGYRWQIRVLGMLTFLLMAGGTGQAGNSAYYSPDLLAMQGRWVRTDAPYTIELRHDKSNKLQASYFNPRAIHVEKTEIAEKGGRQYVMIQLQDVNYDGSLYLLSYDRERDALQVIYIHGASGQRFEVLFLRRTAQ